MKLTIIAFLIFNVLCANAAGGQQVRNFLELKTEISGETNEKPTESSGSVFLDLKIEFGQTFFTKKFLSELVSYPHQLVNNFHIFLFLDSAILINAPPVLLILF